MAIVVPRGTKSPLTIKTEAESIEELTIEPAEVEEVIPPAVRTFRSSTTGMTFDVPEELFAQPVENIIRFLGERNAPAFVIEQIRALSPELEAAIGGLAPSPPERRVAIQALVPPITEPPVEPIVEPTVGPVVPPELQDELFDPTQVLEQFGVEIGEGQQLHIVRRDDGTLRIGIVLSDGWEHLPNGDMISPEGNYITAVEFEAGAITEAALLRKLTTLEIAAQRETAAAREVAIAKAQEFESAITGVFPEKDVAEVTAYIADNPEGFLNDIRTIGKTKETLNLLALLGMTDEDIREVFGELPLPTYDEWVTKREAGFTVQLGPIDFKINLPWTTTTQEDYERYIETVESMPTISRALTAGFGQLAELVAGGARWLGKEGIAEYLSAEADPYLRLTIPDMTPNEITWQDIYVGVLQATPTTLALMIPALVVTIATAGVAAPVLGPVGSFIAAAVAGGGTARLIESAMEAGATYDAALDAGMSPAEAHGAAQQVFTNNLWALGIFDMVQMAAFFLPGLKGVQGLLGRGLITVVRNPAGQLLIQGLTEAGEELVQDIFQRQALGEEVVLDDQMRLAAYIGGIMGFGFGGGSILYNSFQSRILSKLNPEQLELLTIDIVANEALGLSFDESLNLAIDKVVGTPEGTNISNAVMGEFILDEQQRLVTGEVTDEVVREYQESVVAPTVEVAVEPAPSAPVEFIPVEEVPIAEVPEITPEVTPVEEVKKAEIIRVQRKPKITPTQKTTLDRQFVAKRKAAKPVEKKGKSLGAMAWDEFHRNPEQSHDAIKKQLVDYVTQRMPKHLQGRLLGDVARAKTFDHLDKAIAKANRLTDNYRAQKYKTWLRDSSGQEPVKQDEITPDATPYNKLVRLIRDALPVREEIDAMRHEEVAKKAALYMRYLQTDKSQEGFSKAMAAFKGRLPSLDMVLDFAAVHMTQKDINVLYQQIADSEMLPFQIHNTGVALSKLLVGKTPTPSELTSLERMFGPELTEAITSHISKWQRWSWEVASFINLPRAVLASIDLSFPLRQGALLFWGQPAQAMGMFMPMFKAAFSEKAALMIEAEYNTSKYAQLREGAGLDLVPLSLVSYTLSRGEEAFMTRFAEKIPGIAHSQRGFVIGGNVLRVNVFDYYAKQWEGTGKTMKDYSALASMINDFTGRGKVPSALSGWLPAMNMLFFSPRLQVGRVKSPFHLFSKSKAVRMIAMRNIASFISANFVIIGLAMLAGATVEDDPRSPDFAKLKFGNTRIDFWAGFQQYARFFVNFALEEAVTSGTGRTYDINRWEITDRFIRSKLAPVPGLLRDLLMGETFLGEEFEGMSSEDFGQQFYNRLTPMFVQDFIDAIVERGIGGALLAFPAFWGASAQTYSTVDWNELHGKLGLPIEGELFPYMDEPETYTTKGWFQDIKRKLGDLTLEDMEGDKHLFNEDVFFIAGVRDLDKVVDDMPGQDLWNLSEEQIWEHSTDNPDAVWTLSQTELTLLAEYEGLDDTEKAAFKLEHPELENPRETYLRNHPEENAQLALFGQADIYSRAAFDKMVELQKQYDIPDSALLDVGLPPEHLLDTHYEWLDLVEAGESRGSREGKWFMLNNPEYAEWYRDVENLKPLDEDTKKVLDIQHAFKTEFDLWEDMGTVGTDDFVADPDQRKIDRQDILDGNVQFERAFYTLNFYDKQNEVGIGNEHLNTYVTYYTSDALKRPTAYPSNVTWYGEELYLMANWDFTMAMQWSGGAFESPDGSAWDTVPTQAVMNLYLQYLDIRNPDGSANRNPARAQRTAFRKAHPELWVWGGWANAPSVPQSQYLEWYRLGLDREQKAATGEEVGGARQVNFTSSESGGEGALPPADYTVELPDNIDYKPTDSVEEKMQAHDNAVQYLESLGIDASTAGRLIGDVGLVFPIKSEEEGQPYTSVPLDFWGYDPQSNADMIRLVQWWLDSGLSPETIRRGIDIYERQFRKDLYGEGFRRQNV